MNIDQLINELPKHSGTDAAGAAEVRAAMIAEFDARVV